MAEGDRRTGGRTSRDRNGVRSRLGCLAASLAAGALAACGLPAAASASAAGGSSTPAVRHAMGLRPTQPKALSAPVVAGVHATAAALPPSVDLTPYAMPVGNQGAVGSCAAWASDYSALGYWENKEGVAGGGLEPMYTYSQVDGGADNGSSIEGNLTIDEQQGIDNQADYWQGNFDYIDTPASSERAHAVNWKLTSYSNLAIQPSSSSTTTQQSIETALAAGMPVVIGIPVYNNFFQLTSANNGLYSGISGGLAGYHAVTALGYSSTGLRIENSWGASWGASGYATLSWSFVNQYVFDAVEVGPLATGQPVSSTAPAITGTDHEGQTLSASTGSWNPAATSYAYQWQRSASASSAWSAISGATGATYLPAATDVGQNLRVLVTATNSHGQGAATSAQIGPLSGMPSSTGAPSITGTPREGQTLIVSSRELEPGGDLLRLSVAALDHRQHVVDDHRREQRVARIGRRGCQRVSAGARDGEQQQRAGHRHLGAGWPDLGRALQHRGADGHGHGASGPDGDGVQRELEPGGHVLWLSVAALHQRRQRLVCDHRRD